MNLQMTPLQCLFLTVYVSCVFVVLQRVAEYNSRHCLNTGLWTSTGTWIKDDSTETEDIRMMETS